MRLMTTVIAAMLIAGPACAAPIDFGTEIVQIDGKPYVDKEGKPEKTTLGSICEQALLANYPDEDATAAKGDGLEIGKEKARRYRLALKIRDGKAVELGAEEVLLLKRLVAKSFTTYIVGRVWTLVDPASVQ